MAGTAAAVTAAAAATAMVEAAAAVVAAAVAVAAALFRPFVATTSTIRRPSTNCLPRIPRLLIKPHLWER